ncbi:MAG: hypothetical protein P4N24_21060, partial [Acidobacteriota bacterium]|nr:hypothetical protein [Acidobacteriota bacterium]
MRKDAASSEKQMERGFDVVPFTTVEERGNRSESTFLPQAVEGLSVLSRRNWAIEVEAYWGGPHELA